ncbi:MAG: hypothetical protein R3C11_00950 [Planctomycetaceae bacterium]
MFTGKLLSWFDVDYASVGQWTSLVYGFGMIVICFAPDTSRNRLDEDAASS